MIQEKRYTFVENTDADGSSAFLFHSKMMEDPSLETERDLTFKPYLL